MLVRLNYLMLLTLITILGYPEWFTRFSLPQLLLQSLTLIFDIRLFSPFISLKQQKGFGRWHLTIPIHFAPNLISSASPSFAPQPPSLRLVRTWVSQFPAITSTGISGWGAGRVWPVPRPRVSSISADEYQGLTDLSAPSPMRLKRSWRSSAL